MEDGSLAAHSGKVRSNYHTATKARSKYEHRDGIKYVLT